MNQVSILAENELLKVEERLLNVFKNEEGEIYRELEFFLKSPKKRIRSLAAILFFKSQNASINEDILNILTAGELVHNASLLHDDVIDGASQRRGAETIGHKFSSKISILAGDFLVSKAIEFLLKLDNPDILHIFLECTKKMSKAEIKQYFLRGVKPPLEEYLEIAEGKTASLFEAIFESAAIITNKNSGEARDFAKDFGILFQLKNDIDDISAKADENNNIYTPKDFLGIEKTNALIDNYLKKMRSEIEKFPESKYKTGLEDLLKRL